MKMALTGQDRSRRTRIGPAKTRLDSLIQLAGLSHRAEFRGALRNTRRGTWQGLALTKCWSESSSPKSLPVMLSSTSL